MAGYTWALLKLCFRAPVLNAKRDWCSPAYTPCRENVGLVVCVRVRVRMCVCVCVSERGSLGMVRCVWRYVETSGFVTTQDGIRQFKISIRGENKGDGKLVV